jgi:hypothetical protein
VRGWEWSGSKLAARTFVPYSAMQIRRSRAYVDLAANNAGDVWFPIYKSLRPDPRFKNLLRDLGVMDYWRETGSWGDYCRPVGGDNFECH